MRVAGYGVGDVDVIMGTWTCPVLDLGAWGLAMTGRGRNNDDLPGCCCGMLDDIMAGAGPLDWTGMGLKECWGWGWCCWRG